MPALRDSDFGVSIKSLPAEIEELKAQSDLNYIDCVLEICERYNIEPESMKAILPKAIKEKMMADALELNLLKVKKQRTIFDV